MFPDVPALSETKGFEGFDFTNWFGLLARAGTPQAILDRLQKVAVEALKDAKVREVLETQAAVPVGNTPGSSATSSARNRPNTKRSSSSPASR